MSISSVINPSNEIDKLTASFANFGLKLATRASDSTASSEVRENGPSYLLAKIRPATPVLISSVTPSSGFDTRGAAQTESLLEKLQREVAMKRARTLSKLATAKKGLASARNFDKYAERAQFPELKRPIKEESDDQPLQSGPYLAPELMVIPSSKGDPLVISRALGSSVISKAMREKERSKTEDTIKDMLAKVDWEEAQSRYDTYGDVDMDFDYQTERPERKLHRAGQRTMEIRKVNSLLDSMGLGDGGRTNKSMRRNKKTWATGHNPL